METQSSHRASAKKPWLIIPLLAAFLGGMWLVAHFASLAPHVTAEEIKAQRAAAEQRERDLQPLRDAVVESRKGLKAAQAKVDQLELDASTVTKREYDLIQSGMTYDQVTTITGFYGEELAASDMPGFSGRLYRWSNADGSAMDGMFSNGRLVQKTQLDLPR